MGVRRSWLRPHRVSYQEWSRFYSRNSAGKYLLSIPELRDLFVRSETLAAQTRQFRAERLNLIIANETPIEISGAPKLVMHIVPFGAFDTGHRVDLVSLRNNRLGLNPLGEYSWDSGYNFDGLVTRYVPLRSGKARSYSQFFRNGCVEAVQADQVWEREGQSYCNPEHLQSTLLSTLPRYLSALRDEGIDPPIAILISLIGVKGTIMKVGEAWSRYPYSHLEQRLDRDELLLPECVIENFDANLAASLRPAFDTLWNAYSWHKCVSYTDEGEYKPSS